MLESAIRIGLLVVGGLALLLSVAWYLSLLFREVRGTDQVVIDELAVVAPDGTVNANVGKPLAQMLQARVQTLAREMQGAQDGLTTGIGASTLAGGKFLGPLTGMRFFNRPIILQTTLLQPIDLKLSVAGVDVGGLIPWLQRGFSNPRTLHFTIYMEAKQAQVFGSLDALGLANEGVRLLVPGANDKPPSYADIIEQLAHEMLRRYLSQDSTNRFELLDPAEFLNLVDIIVEAAQDNRRLVGGRAAASDFAELVPRISTLADKVPSWPELCYLAAWIADSANQSDQALIYYERAIPMFTTANNAAVIASINARISALAKVPSRADLVEGLPPKIDESGEIKFIRDSGPEGSVVGQALAIVLEFQIAKATHQDVEISARYLYYAARKAGGLDVNVDTGAQIKDGIGALEKEGAVEESVWPYHAGGFKETPPAQVRDAKRFRISDPRSLKTLLDVKSALKTNGPIIAGIPVFQGIMSPEVAKSGIVPLPAKSEGLIGGHAIVIVGYDDTKKTVKFANSWGTGWGDKGFGYLPYEYIERYMSDAWSFSLSTS